MRRVDGVKRVGWCEKGGWCTKGGWCEKVALKHNHANICSFSQNLTCGCLLVHVINTSEAGANMYSLFFPPISLKRHTRAECKTIG